MNYTECVQDQSNSSVRPSDNHSINKYQNTTCGIHRPKMVDIVKFTKPAR